MRWLLVVCTLVGCADISSMAGDDTTGSTPIVVTIGKRPAAHDISSVIITMTNGSTETTDTVMLGDAEFPVMFVGDAPGTDGTIEIKVEARDQNDALVGLGTASTPAGSGNAALWLQGVDFAVNSKFTGNQFLTNDFETVGLQVAGSFFHSWMIGFRDDCTTSCSILGRRFNETGRPEATDIGGGLGEFAFNNTPTMSTAIPALATAVNSVVALWDFHEQSSGSKGIACRPMDLGGGAFFPVTITDDDADVVTATNVSRSDRLVVTWQTFTTTQVIRAMTVNGMCDALSAPVTVSQMTGTSGTRRSHVAAAGSTIVYVWIVDGEVHARFGLDNGQLAPTEQVLITKTATQQAEFVRVVNWGTDPSAFALAVRWADPTGMGPGKIELYPLATTGALGSAMLVTDQSGSDFASAKAFGLASREDGTVMVVWHACPTGPGSCDVFGRFASPARELVGQPFSVPINNAMDQTNPSVASVVDSFVIAWTDASTAGLDTSGTSVQARIIVPDP